MVRGTSMKLDDLIQKLPVAEQEEVGRAEEVVVVVVLAAERQ